MTAFGKSYKEIMSYVRSRSPQRFESGAAGYSSIFALDTSVNCGYLIKGETVRRSVKIYAATYDFTIETLNGNLSYFEREQYEDFVKIRFAVNAKGNGDFLLIKAQGKQIYIPVTYKLVSDPDNVRRLRAYREKRRLSMSQSAGK